MIQQRLRIFVYLWHHLLRIATLKSLLSCKWSYDELEFLRVWTYVVLCLCVCLKIKKAKNKNTHLALKNGTYVLVKNSVFV